MNILKYKWDELSPVVTYASYHKCKPGFQFGPRIIFEHQFIYIVRGKGTGQIQERKYEAKEGDLFYYGPHIAHCFRADDKVPYEFLAFHFEIVGDLIDARRLAWAEDIDSIPRIGENRNGCFIGERGKEELHLDDHIAIKGSPMVDLLLQMVNRFQANNSITAIMNRGLMLQLLDMLYEHSLQNMQHRSPQLQVLYHLQARLKQHSEDPYARTWLKDWSGYNEDYIARNFHDHFGITPHMYHMNQKLDLAKQYLETTDESITCIGDKLHFNSIHYFCKIFKKHTGFSPLQYRKSRKIF